MLFKVNTFMKTLQIYNVSSDQLFYTCDIFDVGTTYLGDSKTDNEFFWKLY